MTLAGSATCDECGAGTGLVHSQADCRVIRELRSENERLRKSEHELTRFRGSLEALRALMTNARSRITEREVARWIDGLLDSANDKST